MKMIIKIRMTKIQPAQFEKLSLFSPLHFLFEALNIYSNDFLHIFHNGGRAKYIETFSGHVLKLHCV